MGASQIVISGMLSILAYGMLVLAVIKLFSISAELTEIKEIVKDLQRTTEAATIASRAQSPESLIRAVNSSSYPAPEIVKAGEVNAPSEAAK